MYTENLILKWKKGKQYYRKVVKKEVILATFKGIEKGFPLKNENSKKLSILIPAVDEIFISFNTARTIGELEVFYWVGKVRNSFSISISNNPLILEALSAYCTEGEDYSYIEVKWKRQGNVFIKNIERETIKEIFSEELSNPESCEISLKIVNLIPIIDSFYIDWDNTKDVNILYYSTQNVSEGISIIYHHKELWKKLEKLCKA